MLPARLRIHLPPERLARFHERERDATRPFEGKFESWTYAPIYNIGVVASTIRRALHLETKAKFPITKPCAPAACAGLSVRLPLANLRDLRGLHGIAPR